MTNLNPHNSFKIHVIFSKFARIAEKGTQNEEKVLKLGFMLSFLSKQRPHAAENTEISQILIIVFC